MITIDLKAKYKTTISIDIYIQTYSEHNIMFYIKQNLMLYPICICSKYLLLLLLKIIN